VNGIRVKWNQIYTKGFTFSTSTKTGTIFLDDQVIITCLDNNLQRRLFILQNVAEHFGMEISPENSETMVFFGQDPLSCSKIIVDNKFLQQIKNFKYLCCEIACENENGIQQQPANVSQILGILNNNFKVTLI
jgi:hypothetical protein